MTTGVAKAINAVQAELAAIGIAKEGRNDSQGFRFRGIDQVMNTLTTVAARHGLVIVPNVTGLVRETSTSKSGTVNMTSIVTVRYDFVAVSDGSMLSGTFVGEGKDSGDKATSKALAMAYKYAILQTLIVPIEGQQDDADRTTPEASVPAAVPGAVRAEAPAAKAPASSDLNAAFDAALELVKNAPDLAALQALRKSHLEGLTKHPAFSTTMADTFRARRAQLEGNK